MPPNQSPLSLTAMPLSQFLTLMHSVGFTHITQTHLEHDRAAGAPITADGIINLVAYAAWLVREESHGA